MTEQQVVALFELSEIPVIAFFQLENMYWPRTIEYCEERLANPWWLALTKYGPIVLGWRKRVIHIEWKLTKARILVTDDFDVTKDEWFVHAWGYDKAITYLTVLGKELQKVGKGIERE